MPNPLPLANKFEVSYPPGSTEPDFTILMGLPTGEREGDSERRRDAIKAAFDAARLEIVRLDLEVSEPLNLYGHLLYPEKSGMQPVAFPEGTQLI